MSAAQIPVIGIVGGVGSGKTAVADALAMHLRCCRFDADAAGHQALGLHDVRQRLRERFGDAIFDEHQQVLRSALAERVFGNTHELQQARKDLEAIVHPQIQRLAEEQLKQFRSGGDCDVVVLDAALLFEAGWDTLCDAVVFLDVPLEVRQQRAAQRGWSIEEHQQREISQLPLEEKRRRADTVIDNSAELETAARQLACWLQSRFPHLPNPQTIQVC